MHLMPKKINVPGLKGAYHQQCLGCHRETTQISEVNAIQYDRISKALKGIKAILVQRGRRVKLDLRGSKGSRASRV